MFVVGVLTALVACSIDITIELLAKIKYGLLREWTDHCVEEQYDCLYIPLFMWVGFNVVPVAFGSFLVAFIEPVAGGSGIPQVDDVPKVLGSISKNPKVSQSILKYHPLLGEVLPERGEGSPGGADQDLGLQSHRGGLLCPRWACCWQGGSHDSQVIFPCIAVLGLPRYMFFHSGAVIAAGISQGKSTSLNWDTKTLPFFRSGHCII